MIKTLDDAIVTLKTDIESKQEEWKNNPNYDGCMTVEVMGMMVALNLISGHKWTFGKYGLTYID